MAKKAVEKGDADASAKIANLLTFAENSLGRGQETTSAILGMIESEDFVLFLTKYGCDKFYDLNAELLASDDVKARAKKILAEKEAENQASSH